MRAPDTKSSAAASSFAAGFVFLLITSFSWGLTWPVMKHLLTEFPPLTARGLAGVVGAVALGSIALARGQSLTVPRDMWWRLTLLSLLSISVWTSFIGLALLWLSATEAAVIASVIPVWVAVLALFVLGEPLSPLRAISLVIAMAGLAILFGADGFDTHAAKVPGALLALGATLCVGLGTVMTKQFAFRLPAMVFTAWQLGLGCLPVAIIGLAVEQPQFANLSAIGWTSLAYMTFVQFCIGYACWFAALERLPASTASIGTLLIPVIGVLASNALLGEPLGVREFASLALTLGGVALAVRS